MRDLVKPLVGAATAALLVAAAMILLPTLASAQDIGGMIGGAMRGFGVRPPGYGYRAPVHHSAPATSSHKDDIEEEEAKDSSSKNAKNSDKNSDKNSSDKNSSDKSSADKGSSDKSASADSKPRRQLSNSKDDTPPPAPTAKADPPKSTADDEPSFSPSR